MVPFRFMLLSAVIAAALAIVGITAVMSALNPSAAEVAQNSTGDDPLAPPAIYGQR
ncbi:hypothetical protein [Actinoplanes couchii]|uniref:DUF2613 domain-containing protein n=1 Tax=Actinoplanes couchii TaxID=403638 RepID=A0ABQ3XF80_9ACTN|nr:hypothetical protein [Actinoplanes couchii]MDR6321887.1 flagellar basal body-associated protein FliL [Actinoplanes couchii]GID57155.1 hypothetical protein Aco03nite_055590 [Actinoplanes couchii]